MLFEIGMSLWIEEEGGQSVLSGIRATHYVEGITVEASVAEPSHIRESFVISTDSLDSMDLTRCSPDKLPEKYRFEKGEKVWDTVNKRLDTIRDGPFERVFQNCSAKPSQGMLYLLVHQRHVGELHLVAPKFLRPSASTAVARYARQRRKWKR